MIFTLADIQEAHSKVKSGADFPNYVQDLIQLGVEKYDTHVIDGRTIYTGADGYKIKSAPKYPKLTVANISDKERFRHYLKNHQRGQTDYPTFCKQAAETGVKKWTVDTSEMTCTYYDKSGNNMLAEQIPTAK